jgi:hypothetical protein
MAIDRVRRVARAQKMINLRIEFCFLSASKMITPQFSVGQDEEFVVVTMKVKYIRVSEKTSSIES